MLQAIDLNRIGKEEKRARLSFEYALLMRDRVRVLIGNLRHLAELLLQCHFAQQIADKTRSLGVVCRCRCEQYVLLLSQHSGAGDARQKRKGDAI